MHRLGCAGGGGGGVIDTPRKLLRDCALRMVSHPKNNQTAIYDHKAYKRLKKIIY